MDGPATNGDKTEASIVKQKNLTGFVHCFQCGLGGGHNVVPSLVCKDDLEGDDHDVDGADLIVFPTAFDAMTGQVKYNPDADFDVEGRVNAIDLAVFAEDFGCADCPICP